MASGTGCGATVAAGHGRGKLAAAWRVAAGSVCGNPLGGFCGPPTLHATIPLDNVRRLSYYGHMAIKTERISVRFGPELLDAAEKAAYDQEMALGEWIRYAVAEYLRLSTKEES